MSFAAELQQELDKTTLAPNTLSELALAWKDYYKTPPSYRKPAPPFVLDESLYPIEQEAQLIDYFYRYYTDNPKKILAWVRRIYHTVPRFMQKSFLDNVMADKNPANYLLKMFAEKVRWGEINERMIAEGNHGVIYNEKEVWGFRVETRPNWLTERDKWNKDEEIEIIKRSYYKWARERGLTHFDGKVMLYHQFGFSGMSYYFNHAIDDKEGY